MSEMFKLPASSYEELIKIIQAYANPKEGTALSLDDICQTTGMSRSRVSKNNGFMVQVGLVTEGNKKAATDVGRSLGRAYTSKINDEIVRIWKEIVADVDFLNRMVAAVRIRNGMDRSNFINHIIYSSGMKDSKESRCGAGAIIEILKSVGILSEVEGKINVNDEESLLTNSGIETKPVGISDDYSVDEKEKTFIIPQNNGIVINININCTAEDIDTLGDKIKKMLQQISE